MDGVKIVLIVGDQFPVKIGLYPQCLPALM